MARTFNNLGIVYADKGEWDKAIEFYNKSLKIHEKIEDSWGAARTRMNIAVLYKTQGKNKQAKKIFDEVLKVFERIGDRRMLEIVRSHLQDLKRERLTVKDG
jgi:tetratricopeptide (TPR) repeat protein